MNSRFKVYSRLPTERVNRRALYLDTLSPALIARLMNAEDHRAVLAVSKETKNIVKAAQIIQNSLASGGRIFLFGAGTSGRLGILEASECPPTFGTAPSLIQAVIAGGKKAVFAAQEGAEDEFISKTKIEKKLKPQDVVIGIAASGLTPFTRAALRSARRKKCRAIFITCNAQESLIPTADIIITLKVGPEIIAGSTRLKAATATKLTLNMLTTIAMVGLGKTYGPWMVDLQPLSRKLRLRAIRIVSKIAGITPSQSERFLKAAKGNAKLAILMARRRMTITQARNRLKASNGFLRRALAGS